MKLVSYLQNGDVKLGAIVQEQLHRNCAHSGFSDLDRAVVVHIVKNNPLDIGSHELTAFEQLDTDPSSSLSALRGFPISFGHRAQ